MVVYKYEERPPLFIKSEIMQMSHPNFPCGSPQLYVYLVTTGKLLELANRNACCLRNTSPTEHMTVLGYKMSGEGGRGGLRAELH